MALSAKIQDDIKAALLGGDRFAGDTLRNLKAAILNEEVAQGKRDAGLSDEEIEKVIAREVKKRKESISIYESNGRPELAETERKEIEVLLRYMPEQISEDELRQIVADKISELGVSDIKGMGQVIGAVKQQVGNKADGAMLARVVKELL